MFGVGGDPKGMFTQAHLKGFAKRSISCLLLFEGMYGLNVPGLRGEPQRAQFNIMVSFRQLRHVSCKVKDKSKEVGSKQMADRCHRVGEQNACGLTFLPS